MTDAKEAPKLPPLPIPGVATGSVYSAPRALSVRKGPTPGGQIPAAQAVPLGVVDALTERVAKLEGRVDSLAALVRDLATDLGESLPPMASDDDKNGG